MDPKKDADADENEERTNEMVSSFLFLFLYNVHVSIILLRSQLKTARSNGEGGRKCFGATAVSGGLEGGLRRGRIGLVYLGLVVFIFRIFARCLATPNPIQFPD
jgi:hypothetical protein